MSNLDGDERRFLICHSIEVHEDQKVLARDDKDGFYYEGTVKEQIDQRYAVVKFKYRETEASSRGRENRKQKTNTRLIVPVTAESRDDPLEVGDFVLAKLETFETRGCHIPGTIASTSKSHGHGENKFKVETLDNTRILLHRKKLLKVDPERSPFFLQMKRKSQRGNNSSDRDDVVDKYFPQSSHRRSKNSGSVIKVTVAKKRKKRETEPSDKVDQLTGHLKRMQQQVDDMNSENARLKEMEENHRARMEDLISLLKEKLTRRVPSPLPQSPNPSTPTLRSPTPSTSPLRSPTPPTSPLCFPTPSTSPLQSPTPSPIPPPPEPPLPEECVLYRSYDDGWYYRGSLLHGSGKREVRDKQGLVLTIKDDDVIVVGNRAQSVKVDDKVIAHHPRFPSSYAPATVRSVDESLQANRVKFCDGSIADVPNDEMFWISCEKYQAVVDYIEKCLNRWVGQNVVARSDNTGRYHMVSCKKRNGKGQRFVVQWEDGSHSIQTSSCIFGKYSIKRRLESGDYVIARTADHISYLPGRVLANAGNHVSICFCDGTRSTDISPKACYWISQAYYDLAVDFYRNQKPVVQ